MIDASKHADHPASWIGFADGWTGKAKHRLFVGGQRYEAAYADGRKAAGITERAEEAA
jgi:hypothetical protein